MNYTWFKLHHEMPDDIKLRRFTPQEKWAWVVLLCLASKSSTRGVIDAEDEDIAEYCEFNCTQDWQYFRDKLIKKGMIDFTGNGHLKVENWESRQYEKPSDRPEAVKARVRKHREKKKKQQETLSNALQTPSNANETPQIREEEIREDPDHAIGSFSQRSDPEGESEKETASQPETPAKDDPPKNACDLILEKLLPLTEDFIPPVYRHDWHLTGLLPWRDRLRQVREDFGLFVGRQISFKRDQETQHPLRKGVAHVEKLEETTSGVRKLVGYWRDFEAIAAEQGPRREVRALPLEFDREKAMRAAKGLPV